MAALIAHILASNQQNAQAMQMLAMSNNPCGPQVPFPTWDGSKVNLPLFLARIESYKTDPFFAPVTSWTTTLPGQEIYSERLYADMMSKLPTAQLHQFLSRPEFVNRGFEMLHALHAHMDPSNPENRLADVKNLSSLAMKPDENVAALTIDPMPAPKVDHDGVDANIIGVNDVSTRRFSYIYIFSITNI